MRLVPVVPNHTVTQSPFVMRIKMSQKFYFPPEKPWQGSTLIDQKWISFNSLKRHKTFNVSLYSRLKLTVLLFKNLLILICKLLKYTRWKSSKILMSSKYSVKLTNQEKSKILFFLNLNPNLWYVFYYKKVRTSCRTS